MSEPSIALIGRGVPRNKSLIFSRFFENQQDVNMNEIDGKIEFSQPRTFKASSTGEVVRFRAKSRRNASNISTDCVLKFVPECFRIQYDKEVVAYEILIEHGCLSFCSKPVGKAEWTFFKHSNVVGQSNAKLDDHGSIFVLMLEFVGRYTLFPTVVKLVKKIQDNCHPLP